MSLGSPSEQGGPRALWGQSSSNMWEQTFRTNCLIREQTASCTFVMLSDRPLTSSWLCWSCMRSVVWFVLATVASTLVSIVSIQVPRLCISCLISEVVLAAVWHRPLSSISVNLVKKKATSCWCRRSCVVPCRGSLGLGEGATMGDIKRSSRVWFMRDSMEAWEAGSL